MKPDRIVELRERARILIEYQPTCYVPVTGKELNECLDEIEKLQKELGEVYANNTELINEIDRISTEWDEIQNGYEEQKINRNSAFEGMTMILACEEGKSKTCCAKLASQCKREREKNN